MNPQTLIKDLTETQILSAVREAFPGKRVTDLNSMVASAITLADLFAAIQTEIDQEHSGNTGDSRNA